MLQTNSHSIFLWRSNYIWNSIEKRENPLNEREKLQLQKRRLFETKKKIKEVYQQKLIHKDLEDRNLLGDKSLKLEKIMNEKMSKRRIQIKDLQKQ